MSSQQGSEQLPEQNTIANEEGAPPSSAWVRFLRSYGPTPNNLTLFDEFVTDNLVKAKVKPITLSSPLLEQIKERADSGASGSILIAGTAGDGKTYHCRSLWTHLGGADKDWKAKTTVKQLKLADGRLAVFVKDLSELSDGESDDALTLMERSINGEETAASNLKCDIAQPVRCRPNGNPLLARDRG